MILRITAMGVDEHVHVDQGSSAAVHDVEEGGRIVEIDPGVEASLAKRRQLHGGELGAGQSPRKRFP
jgi:hypothetical protein